MTAATDLAWAIAGMGIVLAALAFVALRRPLAALHVLLDLLLAATLLRLSVDASWPAIAIAAAVILVRQLVTRGLTTHLPSSPGGALDTLRRALAMTAAPVRKRHRVVANRP